MKRKLFKAFLLLGAGVIVMMQPLPTNRQLVAKASERPPTDGIDPATHQRVPHAPPRSGDVAAFTIKGLGNFAYDPGRGRAIPEDVLRLNGSTVRVRGYMLPAQQATDQVARFTLVPSLFGCCYGLPPGVQHTIVVDRPPSSPVAFSNQEVEVEGRLSVGEIRDDGYVVALFHLDAGSVRPVSG